MWATVGFLVPDSHTPTQDTLTVSGIDVNRDGTPDALQQLSASASGPDACAM